MSKTATTSIASIVEATRTKVEEMGGGEQVIGSLRALATACGAKDRTDFLADLGEALDAVGLQLSIGVDDTDTVYASPLGR